METLQERITGLEQVLAQMEELASVSLAEAEKDLRLGRRARFHYRDIVSRSFIAAWSSLALCRKLASLPEPLPVEVSQVVKGLESMHCELVALVQHVQLLLSLKEEEDLPVRRAEGWPRLRDFWGEER